LPMFHLLVDVGLTLRAIPDSATGQQGGQEGAVEQPRNRR